MEESSFARLLLFFQQYKLLRFKRHETVLAAQEQPKGVFFLKKGFLRLYSLSEEGEELTLIIYQPGNVFPMAWAIADIPHVYCIEALSQVELYRAPKDIFLQFLHDNPEINIFLTKRLLTRFNGVVERMRYLVFGNAYKKVASILVLCVARFGRKSDKGIVIEVPLAHRDVASLVGITRETASIELKQLERRGFIAHDGKKIVVLEIKKLEKEALLDG